MRAVSGCVVALLVLVGSAAAEGGAPRKLGADPSCEEQCRSDRQRDDASCEDELLPESSRGLCHDSVQARLDVCLRICDD